MDEDSYVDEEPVVTGAESAANPLAYQLNLDEELMNIYLTLKGEMVIGDKKIKFSEPLLTDYGIGIVMKVLRSILHKGIILSDLDDDFINQTTFWIGFDLATELMKEYERAGVREGVYEMIVELVTDNVYAALRRARHGKTAESLKEQVRIEKVRIEEREKKKGWFG